MTSAKKNRNDDIINDIDIYELVDESLNIVPPTDDIEDVEKRIDAPDEFQDSTEEEKYESFSDLPLINFKKLSSTNAIGSLKLNLMRDNPISSANPDIYKKVYASPELEETAKYLQPYLTTYRIFYWNRVDEIDFNDSENMENLKNLSKYLKKYYSIDWIDVKNASISYPTCQGHVFGWDNVPGSDEDILREFIEEKYELNWTKNAKIVKSKDNSTINISNQNRTLSLMLNNNKTNATLKIDNLRKDTFVALENNGMLDIYYCQMKDAIKILDNNDPTQWIQLQIDDTDVKKGRREGVVFLNISDGATYYLKFDRSDRNKNIWNISDWNGIMQFHVRSLSSKDRLFYWYYVRPKKSGDFDTESIIRINDEDYKGWPDIIYPLTISIGAPDFRFEVTPILTGSNVYATSSLWNMLPQKWRTTKIKYLITYTGSASNTYLGKIGVDVDPDEGCQVYFNNGTEISLNQTIHMSFIDKNTRSLETMISYNNAGAFRIPALWIEGKPYIFEKTVTVDNPLTRLYDILNTYYTIITFFLAVLVKKQLIGSYYNIKNWITRKKLYKKLKQNMGFYYDIRDWIKRGFLYKKLHMLFEDADSDIGKSEYVQLSLNDQTTWKK